MSEPQPPTISLTLELTSRTGSVGLGQGAEWLGAEDVRRAGRHQDDVMPAIARLFNRFGYQPMQLGEIYVSIGPGGFTGIRVAATTAKMLAFATGAKIVAVPTGQVVAESVGWTAASPEGETTTTPTTAPTLVVALATKRGVSWCSVFDWDANLLPGVNSGAWVPRGEAGLSALPELLKKTTGPIIVCADEPAAELDELTQNRAQVEILKPIYSAVSCWQVARRMRQRTKTPPNLEDCFVEAVDLIPCYGRKPEAIRLREARRMCAVRQAQKIIEVD